MCCKELNPTERLSVVIAARLGHLGCSTHAIEQSVPSKDSGYFEENESIRMIQRSLRYDQRSLLPMPDR